MACGFTHTKRGGRCTCCDNAVHVRGGAADNAAYRRVHFTLDDPAAGSTFLTFCVSCAAHAWTPERLDALNRIADVSTRRDGRLVRYRITGVDPTYPVQTWACCLEHPRCPHTDCSAETTLGAGVS